jgi:hypothetical protein
MGERIADLFWLISKFALTIINHPEDKSRDFFRNARPVTLRETETISRSTTAYKWAGWSLKSGWLNLRNFKHLLKGITGLPSYEARSPFPSLSHGAESHVAPCRVAPHFPTGPPPHPPPSHSQAFFCSNQYSNLVSAIRQAWLEGMLRDMKLLLCAAIQRGIGRQINSSECRYWLFVPVVCLQKIRSLH